MNSVLFGFGVLVFFLYTCRAFDADEDVIFKLYTRDNPLTFDILKINESRLLTNDTFDPTLLTRIHIHGFLPKQEIIDRYREVYLEVGDYNFIVVDWIEGAYTLNYYYAKRRVKEVADKVADLIEALVRNGMSLKNLTIVGHSLGAHVAGCAAKRLQSDEKIGTIIGLDPASIGFNFDEKENRLAETDAQYVQIIHTNGEKFGMAKPMGHADIYPNGGRLQPGCKKRNIVTSWFDKCSHHRSHQLFWETLTSNFTAIKCESYEEITLNRCTFDNVTTIMGGDIITNITKPHGVFYIETTDDAPYVIEDYRSFNKIKIIHPDHTGSLGSTTIRNDTVFTNGTVNTNGTLYVNETVAASETVSTNGTVFINGTVFSNGTLFRNETANTNETLYANETVVTNETMFTNGTLYTNETGIFRTALMFVLDRIRTT